MRKQILPLYHRLGRPGKAVLTYVLSAPRIAEVMTLRLLRRSDYKRWTLPANLETWWDERTEKIAQLIPKRARVIEFGAGRRQLEKYLDPSCSYVPSDLTDRGPGTIICDLNERPLPDLRYVGADAAVFGGVLEYIRDLDSLVDWLSGQFRFCVASYAYFDPSRGAGARVQERLQRFYHGYMNIYTEAGIVGLFQRHGYVRVKEETWQNQRIFQFVKREADSAARDRGIEAP